MKSFPPPLDTRIIWTEFVAAFCSALDEAGPDRLLAMWRGIGEKTHFYENGLMPTIASKLGCRLEIERFRCDFTFTLPEGVPVAFVESENAHPTAGKEIVDLCCLAAPVKALIVSCAWHDSEREIWLPRWREIIRRHHAYFPMDCVYGVIVGEWGRGVPDDTILRYYFTAVDSRGDVIAESEWSLGEALGASVD